MVKREGENSEQFSPVGQRARRFRLPFSTSEIMATCFRLPLCATWNVRWFSPVTLARRKQGPRFRLVFPPRAPPLPFRQRLCPGENRSSFSPSHLRRVYALLVFARLFSPPQKALCFRLCFRHPEPPAVFARPCSTRRNGTRFSPCSFRRCEGTLSFFRRGQSQANAALVFALLSASLHSFRLAFLDLLQWTTLSPPVLGGVKNAPRFSPPTFRSRKALSRNHGEAKSSRTFVPLAKATSFFRHVCDPGGKDTLLFGHACPMGEKRRGFSPHDPPV